MCGDEECGIRVWSVSEDLEQQISVPVGLHDGGSKDQFSSLARMEEGGTELPRENVNFFDLSQIKKPMCFQKLGVSIWSDPEPQSRGLYSWLVGCY